MSSQKNKTDSYCVGSRHKSAMENIVGETTFTKETGKEIKFYSWKMCDLY